ncbi:putative ribonuclease H-like domain-containing protein [Tanacetum coccineum]
MLKVSPWKGVVRFGKRGKLNPRYVRLFKVLGKVGEVLYKLKILEELSRVHNTFHVSSLKKCYADKPLAVSLDGLHFDNKLQFVEEPIEIMDNLYAVLVKQSAILLGSFIKESSRGKRIDEVASDDLRGALSVTYLLFAHSRGGRKDGYLRFRDENEASGKDNEVPSIEEPREDQRVNQELDASINSTNNINTASDGNSTNNVNAVSSTVNVAVIEVNDVDPKTSIELPNDLNMPNLEDIVYSDDDEDVGAEADMNNLDAFFPVSPIPTTIIHKDHPVEQLIRDLTSAPQTKRMKNNLKEHGFEDPDFPDRVYKVEKALYGLHQAPRAWYETLSTYLLDNGFQRGKIDKTLFIRRDKGDILLVQVYVDDIIFGSTKKSLCTEFEKMMHKKFQMSSMGELIFFLGLQVKQKEDGIFISQDKYMTEILKKFGFTDVKTASTPMETQKPLLKDKDGEEVDVHLYRSMIGSLMYLTSLRPDVMFAVCACARYQVNPKVSHLHAVKRIFRYLNGQPKLGLWYPKDSPFDLVAYTDSDYAEASLDRKSTTGGCQFFGCRLISWQCKKQTMVANSTTETEYVAASSCCGQVLWIQNQLLDYGYNFMHTKIYIDNESSICIVKNPIFHSKTKHIEIRHHFIRDTNEKKLLQMIKIHTDKNVTDLLTKAFDVSQFSVPSDPTNIADKAVYEEPSMQLKELMDFYTKLQQRVIDLENTKTTQAQEITSLNKRVKKLEKKEGLRTHKLKRLYRVGRSGRVVSSEEASLGDQEDASKQGRKINDIDKDAEITLVDETQGSIKEAVDVTDAVTIPVSVVTITNVELTLAQTLAELKSARPKTKGIVMQEPSESTPTISLQLPSQFDEEEALRLQAKFDKEDRLAREKAQQQKVDDDQEAAKMKELIKIVPNKEEVAVDVIPLATKPPSIMLGSFDEKDLETLWKFVKAKHCEESTRKQEVLVWKLFDSCGVHFVRLKNLHVFMLVEKRYLLTPATIIDMLNKKLQADHFNEMCYQLLKLITKQLKSQ